MRVSATSDNALSALEKLTQLQSSFRNQLTNLSQYLSTETTFESVPWLRDSGLHGGGERFEAQEGGIFNRASINVSQIQYEDQPEKKFASATALSTIIHPINPLAPSIHIHISWTEIRNGDSYWRIMADLNPAIEDSEDTKKFLDVIQKSAGQHFESGIAQGNEYFFIPALDKHRGVCHFYLEGFVPSESTPDNYAISFGQSVIDCYVQLLKEKLIASNKPNEQQFQQQLDYHTLYFFQVLTLDKGTTAGLLIHNQNDVGTLGSLPSHVNLLLLQKWADKASPDLKSLIEKLLSVLPNTPKPEITIEIKQAIANALRSHYL